MQLETVGEIVRILRSRLDLEQVELARACGWRDASAVSRIETDRIRPTRRTLGKLADALGREDVTGSVAEVRAWLFRAAGIPPTADEVRAVESSLPAIEQWGQPALIMDFAWNLWAANALAIKMLSLPLNYTGRNYLELMFEEDGPMRKGLGDAWERVAERTLTAFKTDTAKQSDRRWHRKLLGRLTQLPDFARMWDAALNGTRGEVFQRLRATVEEGTVAMVSLTLTADPRLRLTHIIPEDQAMTRALVRRGLLLT